MSTTVLFFHLRGFDVFLAVAAKGHFDIGSLVSAWAYEANRIFRDLLVGAESQDQFYSILRCGNTKQHWSEN